MFSKKEAPITIGAIIDLSGPNAFLVEVRDGMTLAVDEVNATGGINGREIEVVFKDSRSDPETGKKAFEELEREYHPLLFVSTTSSVSLALAPLAEKYRVPLIGIAVMSDDLTKQNKWVFRYATSSVEEAKSVVSILDYLKIRRVAVLYQDDDARGGPAFSVFSEMFEKEGGTAIGRPFDASHPNLASITPLVTGEKATYIIGFVPYMKNAVLSLRALHYPGAIIGDVGMANLVGSMPEVNGAYTVAPIIYSPAYTFARDTRDNYEAAYHRAFTPPAAAGYDVVKLLAGLFEDRQMSRINVRDILESWFIYPGVLGTIESGAGTRDIIYPLFPVRIENNAMIYLR